MMLRIEEMVVSHLSYVQISQEEVLIDNVENIAKLTNKKTKNSKK